MSEFIPGWRAFIARKQREARALQGLDIPSEPGRPRDFPMTCQDTPRVSGHGRAHGSGEFCVHLPEEQLVGILDE